MPGRLFAAVLLLGLGGLPRVVTADSAAPGQGPTAPEVRQVVRRLLGKAVDLQRCQVVARGGSYLIECSRIECRSCNVTYVVTTLGQKKGQWAVAGTRREQHGDTGQCGCCM